MAYSERTLATKLTIPSAVKAGHVPALAIKLPVKENGLEIKQASERARLAKSSHDARRARDKFFPADLFADPAWDILLILYWASFMQRRMSITSVCVAAAVPPTTALRWVGTLQGLGLVQRESHPTDRRVHWLSLTEESQARLDTYFDGVLAKQASASALASEAWLVSPINPACERETGLNPSH